MTRCTSLSLAAAAALLAAGCAAPDADAEVGEGTSAIIGGTPDATFPGVCAVDVALPPDDMGNPQDPILCTCTLVEQCTVLTSASCVNENVEADMLAGISVVFGEGVEGGTRYAVESVELYRYFSDGATGTGDLALVRLSGTCPAAAPVDIIERRLGASDVDTTLTLVGYGARTEGADDEGIRTRAGANISAVSERFVTTAEVSTCPGDSGGPGFIAGTGGPELATINPRQAGCSASAQRIRLDRFTEDFLFPFIDRFSGPCALDGECVASGCRSPDPDCDPCLWQGRGEADCASDRECPTRDWDCPLGSFTGEACERDDDCEEGGHCVAAEDDATFTYCARACDPAAMTDCPQGMECADVGGGQNECVWPVPSPGSQGFACNSNVQCRSNICEGGICVFECGAGDSCPEPYVCGESGVQEGTRVCLGENLEGGGGFCAVGGDGRGWLGLLFAAGLVPFVLRRRRRAG